MAEYEACILGFQRATDLDVQEILIMRDSDLLIHQVRGEWATKNRKLLPYLECVHRLCKRFIKTEFKHVPKIQNKFAYALATLFFMIQHPDHNHIDLIYTHIYEQSTYCFHIEKELDEKPWYHDIQENLKNGGYPRDTISAQKHTVRRLANQFFLSGEVFYRRAPNLGLLRCVDAGELISWLKRYKQVHVVLT